MRVFSYVWSLPVTWQTQLSHHWIHYSWNPHDTSNLMALSFTEPVIWAIKVLHCGNMDFWLFVSCDIYDIYLDPMTFIYKHDLYSLEIHRTCKYELPTWRLSKVITWNRQTDTTKTIYHAASWVVNNVQHKYYKILHKTTERHLQTITSSHCSLVKTLQITQQCCTTLENSLLIQHISIIYTVQYSRNEIRWWW